MHIICLLKIIKVPCICSKTENNKNYVFYTLQNIKYAAIQATWFSQLKIPDFYEVFGPNGLGFFHFEFYNSQDKRTPTHEIP